MDYFGRVVEELSDLWEEVHASNHSAEAQGFLKALDKAMAAAAKVERLKAPTVGCAQGYDGSIQDMSVVERRASGV